MLHPFRFGVINEQMLAPPAWLAQVQRIESLGYSTFLLRDHLVDDYFGEQYAPLVALASAAAVTTRLRVGTMVIDNDFRHPALLAKEAATLATLSGGRFELGLGAGWLRSEYEQAGLAFDSAGTRIARLAEAIQVLRGLWSGEPLHMSGQYYQISGLRLAPQPAQPLHLLLGGGQRRMLNLAGHAADTVGLLTTSVASGTLNSDPTERFAAAVEQKLAWVREGAGARFAEIELSLVPTIVLTGERHGATERLIGERGWQGVSVEQVWQMPAMFIGDLAQVLHDMRSRRERYGISYYVISDTQAEELAPLVAALTG